MKTEKLRAAAKSRRFWLMIGGVSLALAEYAGLALDRDTVQQIALLLGAWIVGDSLRKTE